MMHGTPTAIITNTFARNLTAVHPTAVDDESRQKDDYEDSTRPHDCSSAVTPLFVNVVAHDIYSSRSYEYYFV